MPSSSQTNTGPATTTYSLADVSPFHNAANQVSQPTWLRLWPGWLALFTASFVLYFFTASRDIEWQDSGQFVLRIATGQIFDPYGLALTHPLHYWLGRLSIHLIPLAPPFVLSLLSALAGSIAVANVFAIVKSLVHATAPAILASAGLALAHTFWHMSTSVEVYTMSAALLTAELWAVVRWVQTRKGRWLVLMLLANGLGLANHNLALLTAPVLAVVLIAAFRSRQVSLRTVLLAVVAWIAGASPFLLLIIQQVWATGHLASTIHSALFGNYENAVLSGSLKIQFTLTSLAFTCLSFPNLNLPAAIFGTVRGRRIGVPALAFYVLTADALIHLAFVLRYGVIDQYTFLVPVYALLAVFAGIGYATLLHVSRRLRQYVIGLAAVLTLTTPAFYVLATTTARHFHVLGRSIRNKPYRDDYRYLFLPWGRGDDSAAKMSQQAVRLAGLNGLLIEEDEMGSFAIEYELFRAHRTDVVVVRQPDLILIQEALYSGRPVVLVPLNTRITPVPLPFGKWKRVGDLYVFDPVNTTAPYYP